MNHMNIDRVCWLAEVVDAKDLFYQLNYSATNPSLAEEEFEKVVSRKSAEKAWIGANAVMQDLRSKASELHEAKQFRDAAISLVAAAEALEVISPFSFALSKDACDFESLHEASRAALSVAAATIVAMRIDLLRAFAAVRLFGDRQQRQVQRPEEAGVV